MKKTICLVAILGLLSIGLMASATNTTSTQSTTKVKTFTLTGNITSIDSTNNTFVVKKSSSFWASISSLLQFWKPKTQTYYSVAVATDTQMTKKVAGQGTVPAKFSDLAITQKVLVQGQLSTTTTQTYQTINAKKVFILTPPSKQGVTTPTSTLIITPTSTPTSTADTCSEKCLAKQYKKSFCRSWTVTLNAKIGCESKEVDIGQTGDCTTTVNGQPLLGVGKACCCSNAVTSTEPIENGNSNKCMWCGQECVKDNPKLICTQVAPPAGYTCEWKNGQCQKVSSNAATE